MPKCAIDTSRKLQATVQNSVLGIQLRTGLRYPSLCVPLILPVKHADIS